MSFTFQNPHSIQVHPMLPDADQPVDRIKNLHTMLIDPLMAAGPSFTDAQNTVHQVPAQALYQLLDIHSGTAANPVLRSQADQALSEALEHYQGCDLMSNDALFIHQTAHRLKLPAPARTPIMIEYSATYDVIPEAGKLVQDGGSTDNLFVAIGYSYVPHTLGVSVADETAFDTLKTKLISYIKKTHPKLPPIMARALKEFDEITLEGLGETLLLRSKLSPNRSPRSFATLLIDALKNVLPTMDPDNTNPAMRASLMPFSVDEVVETRTVTFINVQAHAAAEPKMVRTFWNQIDLIHRRKLETISIETMRRASKLATVEKNERKHKPIGTHDDEILTAQPPKFRQVEPTQVNLSKAVTRITKKMMSVRVSRNPRLCIKDTFNRPNRRHPEDPDRQGTITTTSYAPDIHVYVDRSLSIHERHYQSSLITVIKMAKKLNVDLYYSTFSHYLSEPVLIKVRNRSVSSIYRQIVNIPAASGGTDLSLMWDAINASRQRQRQFSLMVTDFDWLPSEEQKTTPHPKNLYYTPCSNMDWDQIVEDATDLCEAMFTHQPHLAKRMIGMTV